MSYFDQFKNANIKLEILSGLTVALALMPECIAFAIVAHVNPLTGIYTAAIICFITALIGGRPGLISGAAGSVAVVSVALVVQYGIEYLFLAAILMGIIEILIGVFKLAKFIRLVPRPVVYGFLNGLAILIFISQFEQLKTPSGAWISGMPLAIMIVFIVLSMLIVYLFPKISKKVPSALMAILGVSIISSVFGISTKTLGDIASISGGLPVFHIPQVPLTFEAFMIVLPYAILMAAVGLIETLLTVNVVDEMTNSRGKANRESVAQGIANFVCGFFQGMGGCAMVGQTMINLNSGARTRISGITGGIVIFLIILFAAPLVEKIPIAALVGVMFMVAITTFEWASLHLLKNVPRVDQAVMIIVTIITVVMNNLAIAVIIGVCISALAFAWEAAKRVQIIYSFDEKNNTEYYEIRGPLFFAGTTEFKDAFNYDTKAETVVINFLASRLVDQSALAAVNDVTKRFDQNGVKVLLSHLSPDCIELLKDVSEFVEVDILKDPYYKIPSDELD
ncbi:MAG: SulP family inorganic anion transporter [Methanobrevibacter sp.]|uniref:SulP family inorganic anion transporter n=1 Tax=Methanobrevibacter sp. TaxID=66852 RepID=UPI0026E0D8CB|nr:SulP family inorganic anion transporter [Methanobrevibacter sp.]MDO5849440.1 SulP family inorganic anion transporter [Methanobrevibacter sp.]